MTFVSSRKYKFTVSKKHFLKTAATLTSETRHQFYKTTYEIIKNQPLKKYIQVPLLRPLDIKTTRY